MVKGGLHAFKNKRVLLLQGPIGPFFSRLAKDLRLAGAQVFKINFNGGDCLFYPFKSITYRGGMKAWPQFFEDILDRLNIDVVLLFGDCRSIHRPACEIAKRRGLELGVFEEGYVRPNYITLERYGVNGHSLIPRTPLFYLNNPIPPAPPPLPVSNAYWYSVVWVFLYYLAAVLSRPFFRKYRHHRPLTAREALPWIRSLWRWGYYRVRERGIAGRLSGELSGRFFLVPLQVHNDAQIHAHSDYSSVARFIKHVIDSFANHASHKAVLVFKHHPMDRAYADYSKLVRGLVRKHGLQDRCFYIHDQHLPTLLKHTCGVVVVNSTVGLSALYHQAPVKVCGKALYDIEGLTFRGRLSLFWRQAHGSRPNRDLYNKFVSHLVRHTQLNGNFYKRLPVLMLKTGLSWTSEKVAFRKEGHPESLKTPS